ncbi:MAG: preprotein translocase subunit SecE [Erysipelotrichaceae bacterium]|nr:preprotein translocase subunit SecE [Erysipelotrichaceae bacterium]
MKWFSLEGIMTEVKRIRWPGAGELAEKSGKVLLFCALFAAFFVLCETLVAAVLRLIGVGA